jgi:hypothetical protein
MKKKSKKGSLPLGFRKELLAMAKKFEWDVDGLTYHTLGFEDGQETTKFEKRLVNKITVPVRMIVLDMIQKHWGL